MAKKKIEIPRATECEGWVGTWRNGRIGWQMPPYCYPRARGYRPENVPIGHRLFLCKIIIEPITDANGRPITRVKK